METSSHDHDRLRANALPSPVLTPVAEEPRFELEAISPLTTDPSLNPTGRVNNDSHPATQRDPPHLGLLTTIRDRASSFTFGAGRLDDAPPSRQLSAAQSLDEPLTVPLLKLSPAQIEELTSAPESVPIRVITPTPDDLPSLGEPISFLAEPLLLQSGPSENIQTGYASGRASNDSQRPGASTDALGHNGTLVVASYLPTVNARVPQAADGMATRPSPMARSKSAPFTNLKKHPATEKPQLKRLNSKSAAQVEVETEPTVTRRKSVPQDISPVAPTFSLPLPPLSIPTHLHLELSSDRPSPLYIYRSASANKVYESTNAKFERLLNFLLLPPQLEQVLLFGALTCLDAWLYTFTILPLRFIKAIWILFGWVAASLVGELRDLTSFIYQGMTRVWHRYWRKDEISGNNKAVSVDKPSHEIQTKSPNISPCAGRSSKSRLRARTSRGQARSRSTPSLLQANHKADILQGLLIIISSIILLRFDASRMYHAIRGQAAIKLYVIYNVLEVCDRLFSALGQDIMDCLFSPETLERKPNGRSRIVRPFWMFLLALIYTVIHAAAFFYQVITLNVAVNSYSNALLTLLMSNQFVEIKGTVFKKIEKENLFQLTCADVVERFQLWLMLVIIALRNIVELGGLSVNSGEFAGPSSSGSPSSTNSTSPPTLTFGILPNAFQILPSLFPAQVLGPFLLVLGSEMLVDWLKHAYITKFNATSHAVYGRFLDVLAKDYYSNAFAEQNLTRRLGLPVIPLACLFIRAILQTYHIFLATNVSTPLLTTSSSTGTSLSPAATTTSTPVLVLINHLFRSALGCSSLSGGGTGPSTSSPTTIATTALLTWTLDDALALMTMLVFFLALYLLLLVSKLVLGMLLLGFARERYKGMKARERQSFAQAEARRVGGLGAVELGDERRRVIYEGDAAGLKAMRERESRGREGEGKAGGSGGAKAVAGDRLDGVDRYSMVAKRIW